VAAGRPIFIEQSCLASHRVEGQGGHVGPALDTVGLEETQEQLVARMQSHRVGEFMPTVPPSMTDQELNNYVGYVLTLNGTPTIKQTRLAGADAATQADSRTNCAACHGPDGSGTTMGRTNSDDGSCPREK
jgi:mono/diheme cytochrome c family protein